VGQRTGQKSTNAHNRMFAASDDEFSAAKASATPPVLGGRRTMGTPANDAAGLWRPPASAASRTSAPQDKTARPAATTPVSSGFAGSAQQPGATSSIFASPAQRLRRPAPAEPLAEVPPVLRSTRTPAAAHPSDPPASPTELASRHAGPPPQRFESGTKADHEDEHVVVDEDAFVVPTPGGPVVTNRKPAPVYQPKHRPSIGHEAND
jgi:hypothetical protein